MLLPQVELPRLSQAGTPFCCSFFPVWLHMPWEKRCMGNFTLWCQCCSTSDWFSQFPNWLTMTCAPLAFGHVNPLELSVFLHHFNAAVIYCLVNAKLPFLPGHSSSFFYPMDFNSLLSFRCSYLGAPFTIWELIWEMVWIETILSASWFCLLPFVLVLNDRFRAE